MYITLKTRCHPEFISGSICVDSHFRGNDNTRFLPAIARQVLEPGSIVEFGVRGGNLNNAPSNVNMNIGFRCASTPLKTVEIAPVQNAGFTESVSFSLQRESRLGYRVPPKAGETQNRAGWGAKSLPAPSIRVTL